MPRPDTLRLALLAAALPLLALQCVSAPPPPPPPDAVAIQEEPVHLGDDEVKGLEPDKPHGPRWTHAFTMNDPSGRWGLAMTTKHVTSSLSRDFERGQYRNPVTLNGREIGCLNEFVDDEGAGAVEVLIPIPDGLLKKGENSIEISAGGNGIEKTPNLDDFELSKVTLRAMAKIRLSIHEADARRPLPSKVSARGVKGTTDPHFGPVYLCARAGFTVFTASGTADLLVPQGGAYRLTVSRGFEYTAEEFEVVADHDLDRTVELRRCIDTSGYIACDFHLHSDPSGDSRVPLEDRVTCCAAEGLEFVVSTDHNSVTDYTTAIAATRLDAWLKSAIGDEITTHRPGIGHFNAFPLLRDPAKPGNGAMDASGLTPSLLLERLAKVAARPDRILQINHPRDGDIGYFDIFKMDPETATSKDAKFHLDVQSIEVFNGISEPKALELVLQDWFGIMNQGRFICAAGNSDSHKCVLHDAGYARTFVRLSGDAEPGKTRVEEVIESVRAGRAMPSSGPFVRATVGGKDAIGEILSGKSGPVTLEVEVQATPWIEMESLALVENGKTIETLPIPDSRDVVRLRHSFQLSPKRDSWYVLIARGNRYAAGAVTNTSIRPAAFTNPIRIDADGDGVFTPPASAGGGTGK